MKLKWKIIIVTLTILISFIIFRLFFMKYYYDFLEFWTLRNKIVWTEHNKLEWSDLEYNQNKEGLYVKMGLLSRFNVNDPILFRSYTVFMKEESSVSDTTDIINLRVAQAKYDLLEIYRRKMVKEVDSLRKVKIKKLEPTDFELMNKRYYDKFYKEWQKHLNSEDEIKSLISLENKIKKELINR